MEPQPLVCPSHTTQYIGTLLVGILVGAGASFVFLKQGGPSGAENTYQAGFDAAKKLVIESPAGGIFRTPDDVRSLSGTVTAVSGSSITMHMQSANPFDDPALADRIITVTKDTKITKISQGDPKAFQAEIEAYMKKVQSGKGSPATPPTPPQPTSTTITVSGIAKGDILNVTAGENIKSMKTFTASDIQVHTPSAPVPPPTAPTK